MKRLYAPITKTEEADDGTIKVWGYASTGAEDEDGETILPDAIKAALPDYLKWGAVREMHQPKAVGTAIEADVQADGRTWFGAHVVDPIAVKKIRNNVLKGFSVGGRVTERDEVEKTTITGIRLIEVSLVDRPANPECEILIAKRSKEADIDDLAELLKSGKLDTTALLDAADALAKKDDSKPYGDVEYADPGYQEDKKKRYPIDTESHIRAAWNYINKEKNQAQYSSKQVSQIKARIVAAWKKKIDKDGPPSAEKLSKGLYSVAQFAQCLESLAWVAQAAQGDFDWEGDGSPVPEKLRDWMQEGADIFCEMAEEEANELVDSLREQAGQAIERIMKGQSNMDPKLQLAELNKAGAKFSKETKAAMDAHVEHLGKLHKHLKEAASMCKEACDKMDALMPKTEPEDDDDDGEDGKKAAKIIAAAVAKAATIENTAEAEKVIMDAVKEARVVAKGGASAAGGSKEQATELAKIIADALTESTADIRKTLDAIARQPVGGLPIVSEAAAAALLASRGATAVSRSQDGGGTDPAEALKNFTPVHLPGGKVDEGATLVKALMDPSRAVRSP